jgi:D-alanine--poly(phosphoribitol) ligase subunit 1
MKTNVLEYLESGAGQSCPERTALVDRFSEITFGELVDRSKAVAMKLRALGDARRRPIVVLLPKSIDVVVSDLAVVYTGNFYSNVDEKTPLDRLSRLLGNIEPYLIITTSDWVAKLESIHIEKKRIVDFSTLLNDDIEVDSNWLSEVRKSHLDTDPLCLINTSGSTGTPKSVVLSHRSTIDFIDWCLGAFDFHQEDRIGSLSPLFFDIYTLELFVSLARGCSIFLIPEEFASFPVQITNFLAEKRITFIFWVPTVMVNIANLGLLEKANLTSIRRIFFAGEVFPTRQMNMWRRKLPEAQFVNLYGPIEITVDCTYYVINREFQDHEPLPIGIPCENSGVFILGEADHEVDVPNVVGEICVRGTSLALGYYNNPSQTEMRFVQNPLNKAYPELIYRTGDLGYWNSLGELMFVGRSDFQIKHQGYRIELLEIENAALTIPAISNACVTYNFEKKQIVLVFESQNKLTEGEIRGLMSGHLPKYMLPTKILRVDQLPRNPNGKIDRQKIAVEFAERTP